MKIDWPKQLEDPRENQVQYEVEEDDREKEEKENNQLQEEVEHDQVHVEEEKEGRKRIDHRKWRQIKVRREKRK